MEQLKYILNFVVNLPLLPILIYQGKQVRKNIPSLPEASTPEGQTGNGNRTIKLVSIGESTIAGIGVKTHDQGFTGHLSSILSEKLDATLDWKVVAKSGYTAKNTLVDLVPKTKSLALDIIIIGLGGNDTFKMTSPKQWEQNIEGIIKAIKTIHQNIPILFINVPPIRSFPAFSKLVKFVLGRQVDLLHDSLKKVIDQQNEVWYIEERIELITWLDHFKEKKYTSKDFFSDDVHPSELTYKTWAEETAKFILEKEILK